jgi:hypothetical protein
MIDISILSWFSYSITMDSHNFDVSVALTCHREGLLAGLSAKSALRCIEEARKMNLSCEFLVILDHADPLTKSTIETALDSESPLILNTEYGDPGLARNHASQVSQGKYLSFLDADDIWSYNWITSAWLMLQKYPNIIAHSQCNIVFGERNNTWWHVDSESYNCDPDYLVWANYWDSLSFSHTAVYRKYPFRANNLAQGFGHEDWLWNHSTLMAGLPHRPVPNTIHFKRARPGSQMSKVTNDGNMTWPDVQQQWLDRRTIFNKS